MQRRQEPLLVGLRRALEATADWPDDTLIVRGDSSHLWQLTLALENNPHPAYVPNLRGWSVQAAPGRSLYWLYQKLMQDKVRTVSLATLRASGGRLAKTPGAHEHCTVIGIDAETFHGILSPPERNPTVRNDTPVRQLQRHDAPVR